MTKEGRKIVAAAAAVVDVGVDIVGGGLLLFLLRKQYCCYVCFKPRAGLYAAPPRHPSPADPRERESKPLLWSTAQTNKAQKAIPPASTTKYMESVCPTFGKKCRC